MERAGSFNLSSSSYKNIESFILSALLNLPDRDEEITLKIFLANELTDLNEHS